MNKIIVIASVLKPVDDVRACWKIAQSLAKTNKYEVNIIGNGGKKESRTEKIHFICHYVRRSQFIRRILVRFRILLKILHIKPDVLVITTHELITIAIMLKVVLGCRVVYDIQENYFMNASLHGMMGRIIGFGIRLKEKILAPNIDVFWLAEACYAEELKFAKRKIVVENKALDKPMPSQKNEQIRAIYSGTISEYSGAKIAFSIMKKLKENNPEFEGIIIGQVHDKKLASWLRHACEKVKNIRLIISDFPIPYEEILDEFAWANLGIIAYLPNQTNQAKIPTKLYEYSRYRIPYLVQENSLWSDIGKKLGGAISLNLKEPNLEKILDSWKKRDTLFPENYPHYETWESESNKILDSIKSLLKTR